MTKDIYAYSLDDDAFYSSEHYDTRKDALDAGIDEAKDCNSGMVWTGKLTPYTHADFLSRGAIENIIEWMDESAFDNCFEGKGDYLKEINPEKLNSLRDHVLKWFDDHKIPCNLYRVTDEKCHKVDLDHE